MKRGLGFWLAVGAAVLVVLAIVAGLAAVGGPGTARLEKLDAARLDQLRAIEQAVDNTWRRTGALPPSLESLDVQFSDRARNDPETGEPYEYRVLSDSTAELCGTFAQADDFGAVGIPEWSDIGPHRAGRHCFTLYPPRPR